MAELEAGTEKFGFVSLANMNATRHPVLRWVLLERKEAKEPTGERPEEMVVHQLCPTDRYQLASGWAVQGQADWTLPTVQVGAAAEPAVALRGARRREPIWVAPVVVVVPVVVRVRVAQVDLPVAVLLASFLCGI